MQAAHLDHLEAFPGLTFAIRDRQIRKERRVADDRCEGIAVLVREPLTSEQLARHPIPQTRYSAADLCRARLAARWQDNSTRHG